MSEQAVGLEGDPDLAMESMAEEAAAPGAAVHVVYQLTGADYRSATIELAQQSVTAVAAGTFIVGAGVIPVLNGDLVSIVGMAFGASLATGVYCLPFIWWAIRQRSDLLLSRHDLTVDSTGIRVATPMTVTQQAWPTFRRVRELTHVFTLDYGTGANAMVPKRALDPATAERFRAIVRSFARLETPGRWTNFARGIGLGALAAVAFVVVIAIQASGGR